MSSITASPLYTKIKRFLDSYPVDVKGIADTLNISVVEEFYSEGASGSIKKNGNDYIISVAITHPETRKRFTIAHEITHYLLHKHYIDEIGSLDRSDEGCLYSLEVEADKGAADILMPYPLIIKAYEAYKLEHDTDSIPESKLAKMLGVSIESLKIRLENM